MKCFVHHIEGFGLDPVGSGEPLKVLDRECDMIRSMVQKMVLGKLSCSQPCPQYLEQWLAHSR